MSNLLKLYFSIIASIVFLLSGCNSTPSISNDASKFSANMASKIQAELPNTPVSIKAPLTLTVGQETLFLQKIYAYCSSNPSSCEIESAQYAKDFANFYKQPKAVLSPDSVRLVVRTQDYISSAMEKLGPNAPKLVNWPLVKGLVIVAVLDTPSAIRPLNQSDLTSLNLTSSQLFDLASKNMAKSLKPLNTIAKPVENGQIGTIHGEIYNVGRVANFQEWAQLAHNQKNTLLIALPTTDTVLYVSDSSTTSVDALKTIARSISSRSSNPLSDIILKWTPTAWEVIE